MRVSADDGRVYLSKDVRERYGEEFELVDRGDAIVLVPVPEDPLAALKEEASKSEGSVEDLADAALDEATEQAGR